MVNFCLVTFCGLLGLGLWLEVGLAGRGFGAEEVFQVQVHALYWQCSLAFGRSSCRRVLLLSASEVKLQITGVLLILWLILIVLTASKEKPTTYLGGMVAARRLSTRWEIYDSRKLLLSSRNTALSHLLQR